MGGDTVICWKCGRPVERARRIGRTKAGVVLFAATCHGQEQRVLVDEEQRVNWAFREEGLIVPSSDGPVPPWLVFVLVLVIGAFEYFVLDK